MPGYDLVGRVLQVGPGEDAAFLGFPLEQAEALWPAESRTVRGKAVLLP